MKIIKPYHEIMTPIDGEAILKHIEACGRVCYKSEHKITDDSYLTFVRNIVKRGHEAVLEHFSITVKFVCDRGVSHEIVRHRMASYCQESTRYCNYSKDDFKAKSPSLSRPISTRAQRAIIFGNAPVKTLRLPTSTCVTLVARGRKRELFAQTV